MDTLTVIFAGLICHVLTAGGVQRAVLVAAPSHSARMIIRSGDIVSESGPPLAEESGAPIGERWLNIAGTTIKFGGLPAGTPVVDASFAEHVVPLSMISDATEIRPEIDAGRLFSGAAAYVDLPAGLLSASDLFPQQVTFDGSRWSGSKCLAHHVVFSARGTTTDTLQIRASSGATITLRTGTVLRVENEPTILLTPHFHMYEQLLVGSTAFSLPLRTGNSCESEDLNSAGSASPRLQDSSRRFRGTIRPASIDVECTSSHWP